MERGILNHAINWVVSLIDWTDWLSGRAVKGKKTYEEGYGSVSSLHMVGLCQKSTRAYSA